MKYAVVFLLRIRTYVRILFVELEITIVYTYERLRMSWFILKDR